MGAASRKLEGRTSAMMQRSPPGRGGDSTSQLGRGTKMAKMVDRIRKALGIPARIQGAAYTDEWWGDVPPATSAVMYGVELAYVGTDAVRTPTHGVPALFQDIEEIEEEDDTDWEAKLREAKARAAA